jgi:hypothetical protein
VCPAGKEVQQRQDRITPKATMQQRAVAAPPAAEPKKDESKKDDAVEIDMGN